MSLLTEFDLEELKEIVANSFSYTEVARKIGYISPGGQARKVKEYLIQNNIPTDHFKITNFKTEEEIFIENSTVCQSVLREWYRKGNYTEYKCSICGLEPFWQGKDLTLTLDHINGKNNDDRLENLRWICPNCDRQLETFGSRNIVYQRERSVAESQAQEKRYCLDCGIELKSKTGTRCPQCAKIQLRVVARPTPEELDRILKKNHGNFSAVSRIYGVSDNAIRKWCKNYNMPSSSKEY